MSSFEIFLGVCLVALAAYHGYMEHEHRKERDALTKKLMSKTLGEYATYVEPFKTTEDEAEKETEYRTLDDLDDNEFKEALGINKET